MPEMFPEVTVSIVDKLDALAEYQAQLDQIEFKRKELMDAVKIPEEVQAAHEKNLRRKAEINDEYQAQWFLIEEERLAKLKTVVVPPEVQAVMDAILHERDQIQLVADNSKTVARADAERRKALIDGAFNQAVVDIYEQIAQRKAEIDAEFGDKIDAVNINIDALTEDIRRDVIRERKSVKGVCYHAVFMPGRVTWNTDRLEGMMALIPQIKDARKEGAPSVTIRKV